MASAMKRKRQAPFHSSYNNSPRSFDSRKYRNHASSSQARPGNSHNPFPASEPYTSRQLRPSTAPDAGVDNGGSGNFTDDDLDQVIMAIDKKDSGTVGCSYYSAQEERLYLLGDIRSAGTDTIDSRSFES